MESGWPRSIAPIGLILLFQLSSLVIREFLRMRLQQAGMPAASAGHVSALGGFLVLGVLLAPLLLPARHALADMFRVPVHWRRVVLEACFVGLLLRAASWSIAIGTALSGLRDVPSAEPAATMFWWQCPPWEFLVLKLAVLALATPLVEETLNRGVILGGLLANRSRAAIPLSAALFATFHAPDSLGIAFLFGLTAGRMMMRQRSLLGPATAHATFNGLSLLDWDCLTGVWIPADNSQAAALACVTFAVAAWSATWKIAGTGGTGPGDGPGAADATTRRSPRAR